MKNNFLQEMQNRGYLNQCTNLDKLGEICNKKPISFEVFGDDYKSMKKQALIINSWGKNVYVKIPVNNSRGLFMGKLIKELNAMNIKLNIKT